MRGINDLDPRVVPMDVEAREAARVGMMQVIVKPNRRGDFCESRPGTIQWPLNCSSGVDVNLAAIIMELMLRLVLQTHSPKLEFISRTVIPVPEAGANKLTRQREYGAFVE